MKQNSKIYVAGHKGLAGSAIWRNLLKKGYRNLIGRNSSEVDLRKKDLVDSFFDVERPEYVFLAAGHVGGIRANSDFPVDFILNNILIQNNVIDAAHRFGVRKLLFLGSSCVYPRCAPQPIREEYLMSGPLESTNEGYAIAKIAGIELCQAYRRQYSCDFICAMPTNLYGPNDNYNLSSSHVLAGMLRRFHNAKVSGSVVNCWGSGKPLREFLHSDDFARAIVFLMKEYSSDKIINVGSGCEVSIKELSGIIASVVGFTGDIVWDLSQPDGTPRKLLDCSRILELGWNSSIDLESGITSAYKDFIDNYKTYNNE